MTDPAVPPIAWWTNRRKTVRIGRTDAPSRGYVTVLHVHSSLRGGFGGGTESQTKEYHIRQIALGTGLDVSTVSRILTGERTGRIQTISRLAQYFGLSLTTLNQYLETLRSARATAA